MRSLRKLKQGVWYEIRTRVNDREPLFRRDRARALFTGVFRETGLRFVFEIRVLRLEDDWLMFYMKPEDGLELPAIMKWMKQTFARRCIRAEGRIGHIWGDRYWSAVLEGEPLEESGGGTGERGAETGGRPRPGNRRPGARFSPQSPPPATNSPGEAAEQRPVTRSQRHSPSQRNRPRGKPRRIRAAAVTRCSGLPPFLRCLWSVAPFLCVYPVHLLARV
ncbi:MAG: transposase [Treponema sp.]|nr:transposase [Treponema sp.]